MKKWLLEKLKSYFVQGAFWVVIGLVGLIVLLLYIPGYAPLGEALLLWGVFLLAFGLVDKVLWKEINTIQEIQKGNVAYALLLVAFALLFLAVAVVVG